MSVRDWINETFERVILLDPPYIFDPALVGVADTHESETVAVYDEGKTIRQIEMHMGITHEEAVEWFEYNTVRACCTPAHPIFMEVAPKVKKKPRTRRG